jgi:hypothetical protein
MKLVFVSFGVLNLVNAAIHQLEEKVMLAMVNAYQETRTPYGFILNVEQCSQWFWRENLVFRVDFQY